MKHLQAKIKAFCRQHKMDAPLPYRLLDLVSEVGEVAKEVLKMSDYGRESIRYRPTLKDELGDLLFALIALANTYDIDLEEALDQALAKYAKRIHDQGSASSLEGAYKKRGGSKPL